jgi:hypothetical protein
VVNVWERLLSLAIQFPSVIAGTSQLQTTGVPMIEPAKEKLDAQRRPRKQRDFRMT